MRTALCVSIALTASGALVASACSLGAFDGYAAGGTGGKGAGPTGTGGSDAGTGGGGTGGKGAGPTGTGGAASCMHTQCGASCVDTTSDPANCGACGTTCAAGYACTASVCDNAVVDVSTALATCAVLHGGEVWCWGRDVWGETGIAPTGPGTCYQNDFCQTTPTKISGLPASTMDPAVEVNAGREATCARTRSGAVYCWGSNEAGMLGHSPASDPLCTKATTKTSPGRCSSTPQPVGLPAGVVAVQISLGTVTACALTTTKDVYCWGSNASGEETTAPSPVLGWAPQLVASGVD